MSTFLFYFSLTVMPCITMFCLKMDCVYDSGPIRLQWSWISYKKWKDVWFRNFFFFFSHEKNICRPWYSIPSYLQHLNFEYTHYIPVSHWPVSAQRSLSSQMLQSRGRYSPSRSSLMIFRIHSCKLFHWGPKILCTEQVHSSYLNKYEVPPSLE